MPSNRQIRRKIEREAAPDEARTGRWKPLALGGAVVAILVGAPFALAQLPDSDAQAPTEAPTAEAPAEQEPSATTATAPSGSAAVEVPAFDPPAVDTENPESVARGWAYVYHSRDEQDDYARFDAADGYVPEELRQKLLSRATSGDSPLAGLGASHMQKVTFTQGDTQSTPIRWARDATVTVETAAGRTLSIDYELQVDATDEGWKLTQAAERGWAEVD